VFDVSGDAGGGRLFHCGTRGIVVVLVSRVILVSGSVLIVVFVVIFVDIFIGIGVICVVSTFRVDVIQFAVLCGLVLLGAAAVIGFFVLCGLILLGAAAVIGFVALCGLGVAALRAGLLTTWGTFSFLSNALRATDPGPRNGGGWGHVF
jgi:hypothetical protein